MYHKSVLKNQIWWIIFPLSFIFVSLLGIFIYLFFEFQKNHYEEELYLYREIVTERLKDSYKHKEVLAALLKEPLLSIGNKPNASIDELESILSPSWDLIRSTPFLSEEISFIFILSPQGELFIAENGLDNFLWRDDVALSSMINHVVLEQESIDFSHHFYLSPAFEYTKANGESGEHVFLVKAIFEEGSGRFLGSYGIAIFLHDWINLLLGFVSNIQSVMILNNEFDLLAMSLDLEDIIYLQPNLLSKLLEKFSIKQEGRGGFIFNPISYWIDYDFNLSFVPLELEGFSGLLYMVFGFPFFEYGSFAKEAFIPLVLFSLIFFFLAFIIVYSFMEVFVWKPLNMLAIHIIDISSTGDFFVELPESGGVLIEEIDYLFMQFKFFQKRLASLLFEMKNLYQQSTSTQDVIFEKSSSIYFDSKEVTDRSAKLYSDNEFLSQFLDRFADRYEGLFRLCEEIVSLHKQTVHWKEDSLAAWSNLFEIVKTIDSNQEEEQLSLNINRLREWVNRNGDSLRIVIKELSEIQNLLVKFSQSRLDLTNSFFNVRENLNFLMDNTRETINFLERLKQEVEELFLVQSQDLQKNRDRMKILLKNV